MFPAYANLSAYDRHKKLMNDYFLRKNEGSAITLKRDTSRDKTDADVIRERHKFLWEDDNDAETESDGKTFKENNCWETRLAKKYYDKLFKEYCISDLTHYKKNKVALRWRTENEVVIGKGQFQCGNKRCDNKNGLKTWEVNFGYIEHGEKKNALVKLRLCQECSLKLNYRSKKREVKRRKSLKRLGKSIITKDDECEEIPTSSSSSNQMGGGIGTVKLENETEDDGEKESGETEESREIEKEKEIKKESEIWKEKPTESQEKSREEEFEEYFYDLFM